MGPYTAPGKTMLIEKTLWAWLPIKPDPRNAFWPYALFPFSIPWEMWVLVPNRINPSIGALQHLVGAETFCGTGKQDITALGSSFPVALREKKLRIDWAKNFLLLLTDAESHSRSEGHTKWEESVQNDWAIIIIWSFRSWRVRSCKSLNIYWPLKTNLRDHSPLKSC